MQKYNFSSKWQNKFGYVGKSVYLCTVIAECYGYDGRRTQLPYKSPP